MEDSAKSHGNSNVQAGPEHFQYPCISLANDILVSIRKFYPHERLIVAGMHSHAPKAYIVAISLRTR